jgi:coenzyme F420-0:L-glutamate ligase/coenzyme F420-1:gamma-L-glutamate ligase
VTIAEGFTVFPVTGIPELREGDDLAALIVERVELADLDIVVVAQKAISKIEGRVVRLDAVEPSELAREIAGKHDREPGKIRRGLDLRRSGRESDNPIPTERDHFV